MKRLRFTEEQITGVLREQEAGRRLPMSAASTELDAVMGSPAEPMIGPPLFSAAFLSISPVRAVICAMTTTPRYAEPPIVAAADRSIQIPQAQKPSPDRGLTLPIGRVAARADEFSCAATRPTPVLPSGARAIPEDCRRGAGSTIGTLFHRGPRRCLRSRLLNRHP